jgi:hypothetical protein
MSIEVFEHSFVNPMSILLVFEKLGFVFGVDHNSMQVSLGLFGLSWELNMQLFSMPYPP